MHIFYGEAMKVGMDNIIIPDDKMVLLLTDLTIYSDSALFGNN